ncbi:MAG: hypothetical protein WAO35_00430, partial [Terriglobia bacterium]
GAPAPRFLRKMKKVLRPEVRAQDDRRVREVVGYWMTQVSHSPKLGVTPPSWRLFAGWKPAPQRMQRSCATGSLPRLIGFR